MKKHVYYMLTVFLAVSFLFPAHAGTNPTEKKDAWEFEDVKVMLTTPVENQHRSGTCWSFSGLSFLSSEMIRMGKPKVNFSEMFIVWHTYAEKARKHVRLHGNLNFSAGGAFHDVTNMIAKYGIVPESVYDGLKYGEDKHVHSEMDQVLKDYVDAVVQNKNQKLSTAWHDAYKQILNTYLGEIPETFHYDGKTYTPLSFA